MIIKNIKISNFTCFAGLNEIAFNEGLNVIIGDNGHGKSQLFDAFHWVLENKIFMSGQLATEFTENPIRIVSDKAVCDIQNGEVETSVEIVFLDKRDSRNDEYIFKRTYTVQVENGRIKEPYPSDSALTVYEKRVGIVSVQIEQNKINDLKNRILPAQKKKYLWFQGEQLGEIINFKKRESLTSAVNILSNITKYDRVLKVADQVKESIELAFQAYLRKNTKEQAKAQQLSDEIAKYEKLITTNKEMTFSYKRTLEEAQNSIETLMDRLQDATKITILHKEIEIEKINIKELQDKRDKMDLEFVQKVFKDKWVLYGLSSISNEFETLISRLEDNWIKRQIEIGVGSKLRELPDDVPQPVYVQKMLDSERCFVCGREAKRDSDAWNFIGKLIREPEKKVEDSKVRTNKGYLDELRLIYNNLLRVRVSDESIIKSIQDFLTDRTNLISKINDIDRYIREKTDRIEDLMRGNDLDAERAMNIAADYKESMRIRDEFKAKYDHSIRRQSEYENELDKKKKELEKTVPDGTVETAKKKLDVAKDFYEIAKSTRARAIDALVSELQEEANIHYTEMTKDGSGFRGSIKIEKTNDDNYIPLVVQQDGNIIDGLNTSYLVMMRLSLIIAIMSAHEKKLGDKNGKVGMYTLVADAPFSSMTNTNTLNVCLKLSNTYVQSIVMSKEFVDEKLRKQFLSSDDIKRGKIYIIAPNTKTVDRNDRRTLATRIQEVK